MVTVPTLPSSVIVAPSGIRRVASAMDGTHGMPSSRLTICVRRDRADVGDHASCGEEQRGPRRVGRLGDQDVAGVEPGSVLDAVEHTPCR
ncbi:MAG: hypothetical protein R2715_23895 [Ilumatobacteraceae bacterium]